MTEEKKEEVKEEVKEEEKKGEKEEKIEGQTEETKPEDNEKAIPDANGEVLSNFCIYLFILVLSIYPVTGIRSECLYPKIYFDQSVLIRGALKNIRRTVIVY